VIVRIKRTGGARSDVMIGLLWSLGMALGILFIAMMPGYPPDLSSYLFGNVLSVSKDDLWLMAGLTLGVTIVMFSLYDDWKAYLFDEEFAAVIGVKTAFLEYLLLILIAMTVVVLIRVVGIILVLALLTAPAATAGMLTTDLKKRILYSIAFGCVFFVAGLWLSYSLNIASGACIVILSAVGYFISYFLHSVRTKLNRKRIQQN
ncbi:MAG: metal ABC transporter permease, partial [Clostridia bacterium]|nr:metal ABC transporter permease [Clostridia bacterium]